VNVASYEAAGSHLDVWERQVEWDVAFDPGVFGPGSRALEEEARRGEEVGVVAAST